MCSIAPAACGWAEMKLAAWARDGVTACGPMLSFLSRVGARQGRRVADSAHVPRAGLRPALLLDFAASSTRCPWREVAEVTPSGRVATAGLDQAGGALCAAKSRRRRRPQAGAGGHERSRVPRRPDLAPIVQRGHSRTAAPGRKQTCRQRISAVASSRHAYSVNTRTMPRTVTRWPGLLVSLSTPLMRRSRRGLLLARQISRSVSQG